MSDWYEEPGIQMVCTCAEQLASLVRGWADRTAEIIEALPDATDEERAELVDELDSIANPKRSDTATDGAASVGDFLVMLDMTSMVYGLKPVDGGPGPVAHAGWKLQEQGPVYEAAKRAAREVLDGTGPGDLTEYRELIVDNPRPAAPGIPHLKAVPDD